VVEHGLQCNASVLVLNELTYARHPGLMTESLKPGVDGCRAAIEWHTRRQTPNPCGPATQALAPRRLLVHGLPHGVGLDEDQALNQDVSHVEVCGDEGATR